MLGAIHDFIIEQGQTWSKNIAWNDSAGNPIGLSFGYTANFTIRFYFGETGNAIKKITQADGITLTDGTWNIVLTLTAVETAAMNFLRAVYVLEVQKTSDSVNTRILEGTIMLAKDSTDVVP